MIIKEKQNITIKTIFFAVLLLIISIGITLRVIMIQTVNSDKYEKIAIENNFRKKTIKASRGNIYTSDNVLLATTTIRYHIYLDLKTIKQNIFDQKIEILSDSLSKIFGKSRKYYQNKLSKEKKKQNQYYLLAYNINFETFKRLKNFPIFNKGQNQGGFIVRREMVRSHTISSFGSRLLGFDNKKGQVGLEGAYSKYLRGKDAIHLEQRINSKQWKPINYWEENPIPGQDVYTTINMRMQNIVYTALLKQLKFFAADRGCAILIEVATGKVRAIVNLKKKTKTIYEDLRNYAVYDKTEPGSTFKVMSLLVAMDHGYINSNTTVNIENGKWKIHKMVVNDDYGNGFYDLEKILTKSSNVGTSKLIYKYYRKSPNKFFEKLKSWKLNQPIGIEIKGESYPDFPSTKNKNWSLQKLITSSYGYGINLTPLQILTFYNGIANNGKIVKPKFLELVKYNGKIIKEFECEVIVNKMTSQQNINQMKNILTKAVENGTAKSIHTPNLKMAGKTGTTRIEYWKKNQTQEYQSSFCGFFPSDYPIFSCIVVIQKPKREKGIYGGVVAAPVFKEIAGKVFLKMPLNINKDTLNKKIELDKIILSSSIVKNLKNAKYLPDLKGQIAFETIPQLENLGLKVKFSGTGKILKQSIPKGSRIKRGQTLYLDLEK